MSAVKSSWGNRLYRGDVSYDFIGKQKRWYAISGALVAISLIALLTLGLKFSLDFRGGSQFTVASKTMTVQAAESAVAPVVSGADAQIESGATIGRQVVVKTTPLTQEKQAKIQENLAKAAGVDAKSVTVQSVSGSWGKEITNKAITGLIIFVALVMGYLAIFYEWKMAIAAIVALFHDLLITAGIYALSGFEVSPATVIGFLTILGYSLYDTVVVFDKVKENTKGLGGAKTSISYTQAANLAVNQTLIRSLNTSLIALLPVAALLVSGLMSGGAGVLQDLALALLVGIAVGTYSSIFIATPLLADLKEREPDMKTLSRKVAKSQADGGAKLADRIPSAVSVEEIDAAEAAEADLVSDVPRGPRNQPIRNDRAKNRPSGKKR